MTERQRTAGGRIYDQHYHATEGAPKMTNEDDLSPRKTLLVLVVVIGCFAVLWPKLFYPMLVANANQHIKPSSIDRTTGCCDVISEIDVNTIKIMSELCSTIIETNFETPPKPKEIVRECRKAVLEKCGIDISAVLQERVSLGHSVKQILEEVRSLNGSLCLKYNFGVSPSKLGVPHRITVNLEPSASIRQERPSHLRSEMIHPAFRERGRAIPQPEAAKRANPPPRIVEGRPGPVPGIRPAMGGAGHVVQSKQQQTGVMGLLMPIYTIGIVIFFTYTVMKLAFKKKPDSYVATSIYPPVEPDEHFRKEVFKSNQSHFGREHAKDSKFGDVELDQLRRRLRETELAMERIVEQMAKVPLNMQGDVVINGAAVKPQEDDQASVKIMGMETTASCEGGKKWSRPDSPVLPVPSKLQQEPQPEPQEIFLEGILPPDSQLLVADSGTETQKEDEDSAVVLAGKMTLSVISLDSSENGTDDSSNPEKKRNSVEDERGTNSSHGSDEFEKVEKDFNDESQCISDKQFEKSDSDFSFIEGIEKVNQLIFEDIKRESEVVPELSTSYDVLQEIREQLKLEDDLLEVLDLELRTADTSQITEASNNVGGVDLEGTETSKSYISDKKLELDPSQTETGIPEDEIDPLKSILPKGEGNQLEPLIITKSDLQSIEQAAKEEPSADDIGQGNNFKEQPVNEIQSVGLLKSIDIKATEFSPEQKVKDQVASIGATQGHPEGTKNKEHDEDLENPIETVDEQGGEKSSDTAQSLDTEHQLIAREETESNSEDEVLEDEDVQSDEDVSDRIENEIRGAGRNDWEERISQEHLNENNVGRLQNTEDDSDERLTDEDEDIEEIIEYVENTDEEGEEIIEVTNGVNQTDQNSRNSPH